MNTAQLTPRAQAVIAASDEYTDPIFRLAEMAATAEQCPCGYPMPCSVNVPITLCRSYQSAAIPATAATGEAS